MATHRRARSPASSRFETVEFNSTTDEDKYFAADDSSEQVAKYCDLFSNQLCRLTGMAFVSRQVFNNGLLHEFCFQDKSKKLDVAALQRAIATIVVCTVLVFQLANPDTTVFKVSLSTSDLLKVRPRWFEVCTHPAVSVQLAYVVGFVFIVIACLVWI